MSEPETWRGDPAVLVFAAQWALQHPGSHPAVLVADTVLQNHGRFSRGTRQALVRHVTAWLDGPGATATAAAQEPWLLVLDVLGHPRWPTRRAS